MSNRMIRDSYNRIRQWPVYLATALGAMAGSMYVYLKHLIDQAQVFSESSDVVINALSVLGPFFAIITVAGATIGMLVGQVILDCIDLGMATSKTAIALSNRSAHVLPSVLINMNVLLINVLSGIRSFFTRHESAQVTTMPLSASDCDRDVIDSNQEPHSTYSLSFFSSSSHLVHDTQNIDDQESIQMSPSH